MTLRIITECFSFTMRLFSECFKYALRIHQILPLFIGYSRTSCRHSRKVLKAFWNYTSCSMSIRFVRKVNCAFWKCTSISENVLKEYWNGCGYSLNIRRHKWKKRKSYWKRSEIIRPFIWPVRVFGKHKGSKCL